MAENEKTEKKEEKKEVTPEEKALLDRDVEINKLKEQLAENEKDKTSYSQVVATPEVRAVLDAIDKGETVKVVVGDEEEKEPAYDPETVEDLDNKGLIIASARETSRLLGGILDEKLTPLVEEIEELKGDKKKTQKANTEKELKRALKRFPDLNTYTEKMIELKKENPGMGVEELYVVARTRDGKGFPDPAVTSSERPSSVVPKVRKERKEPLPKGPVGLEQLMDEVHETDEFADVLRGAGTPHEGQPSPE